ncbi:hypothetical protein GCM10010520_60840 [Rhizobium viscosum]
MDTSGIGTGACRCLGRARDADREQDGEIELKHAAHHACELDETHEANGEFVVSRCDTTPLFEPGNEAHGTSIAIAAKSALHHELAPDPFGGLAA